MYFGIINNNQVSPGHVVRCSRSSEEGLRVSIITKRQHNTSWKLSPTASETMKKDKSFPPSLFSEDDCDRPACADTVSALKGILGKTPPNASSSMSKGLQQQTTTFIQCPPTSSLLGNSSWDLLHSMAAWYPDQPDIQHETQMKNFIDALATFYPCTYCAQDFQENIITNPVK